MEEHLVHETELNTLPPNEKNWWRFKPKKVIKFNESTINIPIKIIF